VSFSFTKPAYLTSSFFCAAGLAADRDGVEEKCPRIDMVGVGGEGRGGEGRGGEGRGGGEEKRRELN
jgi:hypothetical protein